MIFEYSFRVVGRRSSSVYRLNELFVLEGIILSAADNFPPLDEQIKREKNFSFNVSRFRLISISRDSSHSFEPRLSPPPKRIGKLPIRRIIIRTMARNGRIDPILYRRYTVDARLINAPCGKRRRNKSTGND